MNLRLVVVLCTALALLACSRRAEIEDLPDAGNLPTMEVPRPDGGVPLVEESGVSESAPAACEARPSQPACSGTNDFGCDFDAWVQQLTESCQLQTDCRTNGWVEVTVGGSGCATALRMEDPDADYVTCMADQLGQYRCPCRDVSGSRFLGLSHDGCGDRGCGTGEFRCPEGMSCQAGRCLADDASGGASAG